MNCEECQYLSGKTTCQRCHSGYFLLNKNAESGPYLECDLCEDTDRVKVSDEGN